MKNFASNQNFAVYSTEEIFKHMLGNIINIYVP
jgi:hypothetical protein